MSSDQDVHFQSLKPFDNCKTLTSISTLFHHQSDKTKEELYEELLDLIRTSNDVRKASQLLCSGAPVEPVGNFTKAALALAITAGRPRMVSLLLAVGAPLVTYTHGQNLLQLAWYSHDAGPAVRYHVTKVNSDSIYDKLRQTLLVQANK